MYHQHAFRPPYIGGIVHYNSNSRSVIAAIITSLCPKQGEVTLTLFPPALPPNPAADGTPRPCAPAPYGLEPGCWCWPDDYRPSVASAETHFHKTADTIEFSNQGTLVESPRLVAPANIAIIDGDPVTLRVIDAADESLA